MNWKNNAVGKFFAIDSHVAGLRADASGKRERFANTARALTLTKAELADLETSLSTTPILHGREADRDRQHSRADGLRAEITRLEAVLKQAELATASASAKLATVAPLANACGTAMLKIGLLNRQEVGQ